jgi:hypothetical protein
MNLGNQDQYLTGHDQRVPTSLGLHAVEQLENIYGPCSTF